jgi:DNA mismatch endonuclease (patch repair protein)
MAAIRRKNTNPELRVRSLLHSMGFRFRLHRKDLPGTPDIVLPKYRLCIFVHGCYWHQHQGCKKATIPNTRKEFWQNKFKQNAKRDDNAKKELEKQGWNVCIIWECETRKPECLSNTISKCLKTVTI